MCHIVEAAKRKEVVSVRETEGRLDKGADRSYFAESSFRGGR